MKSISAIGLLFFFFGMLLNAQDNNIVNEVKVYKIIDNKELITDVFHQAKTVGDKYPAIAFFHGGGWSGGDRSEFYEACKRYAEKGFVTFSFEYRLCVTEDGKIPNPEITPVECVKDARSALRWMKENATSLKIDPKRIVVAGQSAGGQLAWGTAMFDDINEESDNQDISPEPDALLLFSSNLNMVEAWADYLMGDRRDDIWSISPYHNLRSGLPPAIEFHGTKDCQVPMYIAEFFNTKTLSLGNKFEQVIYEGRQHYLGEGYEKYATYFDEEIMERTDEFLISIGYPEAGELSTFSIN